MKKINKKKRVNKTKRIRRMKRMERLEKTIKGSDERDENKMRSQEGKE